MVQKSGISTGSVDLHGLLWQTSAAQITSGNGFMVCNMAHLIGSGAYSKWVSNTLLSCLAELVFPPHFFEIVADVKASGPPHVIKLLLGVSKDMLL